MFPIRDMNDVKVDRANTMVAAKGFYLLEKAMDIGRDGVFKFWKGSNIFKVFPGPMKVSEGSIDVRGSTIHRFTGDDWAAAKAELEEFFDQWRQKWFMAVDVAGEDEHEHAGWAVGSSRIPSQERWRFQDL